MTGTSYMHEIYKDPMILEYLRFNPKWYKILDNDSSLLKDFLNEARTNLKIRMVDKLEDLKGQVLFVQQLMDMM